MSNQNRKATKVEKAHAQYIIRQAFPWMESIWGGHGDYGGHRAPRFPWMESIWGGHRAPRDLTISFRLVDERGRLRSNVVWLDPGRLTGLTFDDVRSLVRRVSGNKR